jgi:methyltransferase
LVARGPYRFLRHPNYAVVAGEFAAVPLALGLPIYALAFTVLNAVVLAIRIPEENAALAVAARDAGQSHGSGLRGSPMVG